MSKPVPNTVRAWWYVSTSINRLRIVGAAFYSTYAGPKPAQHVETIRCSSYHTGYLLPPGKLVVQHHDK